jgi:hypothetical protein
VAGVCTCSILPLLLIIIFLFILHLHRFPPSNRCNLDEHPAKFLEDDEDDGAGAG